MLKYRPSRSAVSAVTPRRSRIISEIRVTGTRNAIAKAFDESPRGFMNSSRSISPGCRAGMRAPSSRTGLVVIDDLNFKGIAISPSEANPVLIVDPQAPFTIPVALKPFQSVSRRLVEVFDAKDSVNLPQFAKGHALKSCISPAMPMIEYFLSLRVGKGANHA